MLKNKFRCKIVQNEKIFDELIEKGNALKNVKPVCMYDQVMRIIKI